jgi:glucose/arabinose dehydrogenase
LLEIPQPQSNHNGGGLVFGPDGLLYIGVGDGGASGDVGLGHTSGVGNGQDTSTLLGKILRIDVDGADPYSIPEDNPFADGVAGRGEIFAWGLRNPWRMSFDTGGGGAARLFAGDVGQDLFEEVNIVMVGGNYGWNAREGFECFDAARPFDPPASCEAFDAPILAYGHRDAEGRVFGTSVIGGYVYRGAGIPSLEGRYIFGDYHAGGFSGNGTLFAAEFANGAWTLRELRVGNLTGGRVGQYILGFGQDAAGELYVLTSGTGGPTGSTGRVYRISPGS